MLTIRSFSSLCAGLLLLVSAADSIGQTEQTEGVQFTPIANASQLSVASGRPLMILGFSDG